MSNYTYLKDASFLKQIDNMKVKEQFVKITALDWNEKPIKEITGLVQSGSIQLDGNSAIRRTANLTMVYKEEDTNILKVRENIISINKKVKIEIGFKNTLNNKEYKEYDIIWFPLGIFVVINFSINHSLSGTNISLQLKDKMCLLNGECGGIFPASVSFHEYETADENGEIVIKKPTIYRIIQELVNHFGQESLDRIIISDLDERIKQVMKWTGSTPVYFCQKGEQIKLTTSETEKQQLEEQGFGAITYSYGHDIGYVYTDFYYPKELIANAGDNVVGILDEIKKTLGNYEYFYDIDGNFVFQEIKNYLNTSLAKRKIMELDSNDYLVDFSKGKSVYNFNDSTLIESYSNSPQFNMIKNDFIIWGVRSDTDGGEWPIRYHLAIDHKPETPMLFDECFLYEDPNDHLKKVKRALKFNSKDDFPLQGFEEVFYCCEENGIMKYYTWGIKVEYDQYEEIVEGTEDYRYYEIDNLLSTKDLIAKDWRSVLYLQGAYATSIATASNDYYAELENEWPKLYDIEKQEFSEVVSTSPESLDYFLDFIDTDSPIDEFSISNIGKRTKVINDDSINCIFEPEIPDYILINVMDDKSGERRAECEERNQKYIQVEDTVYSSIAIGGNFNSAYNMVRNLLYQYTSYNETINISAIPIYYLEPNTRISVTDSKSGINGDYMITSISLPLDVNSSMSISAIKAIEQF